MYFEAEMKGKKYSLDVFETRSHWVVTLQEKGKEAETHRINKVNYRSMDDAISFLFENSSYMLDVTMKGLETNVYTRGSFRTIKLWNDESLLHESLKTGKTAGGSNQVVSGMPGKIVDVLVKAGQTVKAEQALLIMEAMKMENELRAPRDAKIKEVKVTKGQSCESGALLIEFFPEENA
jgi:biotin carboxyl carrier protein